MVFNEETSQDQLFMPVAGQAVEPWTEYLSDLGLGLSALRVALARHFCIAVCFPKNPTLYHIILYCIVLYCIVLYCIVL